MSAVKGADLVVVNQSSWSYRTAVPDLKNLKGNSGIVGDIVEGSLDLLVDDIVIKSGERTLATGRGRLYSLASLSVLLEAYVDLQEPITMNPALSVDVKALRGIVGDDDRLVVSGTCRDGDLTCTFIEANVDPLTWTSGRTEIKPVEVQLVKVPRKSGRSGCVALVSSCELPYGVGSAAYEVLTTPVGMDDKPLSTCPSIPARVGTRLRTEVDGLHITVEKVSEKANVVRVHEDSANDDELRKSIYRVAAALSILAGKSIEVYGYQTYGPDQVKSVFLDCRSVGSTKEGMWEPISLRFESRDGWIRAFECFVRHFRKDGHVNIVSHLQGAWCTHGLPIDVHELLVAVAIEGLVKDAFKALGLTRNEAAQDLLRLRAQARKLIEDNMGAEDSISLRRVLNALQGDPMNFQAKLEAVSEMLDFKILPEELQAWKDARNDFAHGTLAAGDVLPYIENSAACLNLLYKLVLAIVDYRGPRFCYFPRDARETESFRPPSNSDLSEVHDCVEEASPGSIPEQGEPSG